MIRSTYCPHSRRVTWQDDDQLWSHDDDSTVCRSQAPLVDDPAIPQSQQPERDGAVEFRFTHTTTRSFRVNAADLRDMFGLAGTPADALLARAVLLLEHEPGLLGSDEVEGIASWESDTAHKLMQVAGMTPGEAAEYIVIVDPVPSMVNPGCVRCSADDEDEGAALPCACTIVCKFPTCAARTS